MYVLDEPSIGLHQRDNLRLIATLRRRIDAIRTAAETTLLDADMRLRLGSALDKADTILVGGAMAHTFRLAHGGKIAVLVVGVLHRLGQVSMHRQAQYFAREPLGMGERRKASRRG
jgi:excinuclease UvrABC ATPase subunit